VEEIEGDVSARDLSGKVLWRYDTIGCPWICEPLAGGTIFVAQGGGMNTRVVRLDADGRQIALWKKPWHPDLFGLQSPQMLRNGYLLLREHIGDPLVLLEVNAAFSRRRRVIRVQEKGLDHGCDVEPTPAGTYMISGVGCRRVLEVNAAGETVWQFAPANGGTRLLDGNTLIAAEDYLAEVDRGGNVVREVFVRGRFLQRPRVCLPLVRVGFDLVPGCPNLAASLSHRLRGLRSKNAFERAMSIRRIKESGKAREAIAPLVEALADPDDQAHGEAGWALASIGPPVLPALLKATSDKRPRVRAGVVWTLGGFQGRARAAVPDLIRLLKDESVEVRRNAAWALGRIGPAAKDAVPALAVALADPDTSKDARETTVSRWAARSLGEIGPGARSAVPALIKALDKEDVHLQILTIGSLGEIGAAAKGAVEPLSRIIREKRRGPVVRRVAVEALGKVGSAARGAIPALRECLRDPDPEIHKAAAQSLKAIPPPPPAED
jgi:HEAT repeat protein